MLAFVLALHPVLVYALPTGGQVAAGTADIQTAGSTMNVNQSTNSAVVNWQGFDIGGGETVNFNQPGATSITLNRVTGGGSASQILGAMNATGQVWLINPNGVVFGAGAQVDVGGLLATTSNISDSNFMAGNYRFDAAGNPLASISNAGSIHIRDGGLAALVGANVTNSGLIAARLGKVQLASGDTFTLDLGGDGLINLQASGAIQQQLVQNSGSIMADGGSVLLTVAAAENTINGLINMDGMIQANSVGEHNGEVTLYAEGSNAVAGNVEADKGQKTGDSTVMVSGTIITKGDDAGEKGGTVKLLADQVAVMSGASIDASGQAGGGVVRVGGDYHGEGDTPTAKKVIVQEDTSIKANALDNGDGGNVTVWADDWTNYSGSIEAKGGVNGGDGGFIETSGKNSLSMYGIVDASSAWGQAGVWLLDPDNLTVNGVATTNAGSSPNWTAGAGGGNVLNTEINTALNAGTAVILSATGSITVNNAISKTAGADTTLTLRADQNIIINAAITSNNNKLNVVLNSNRDASGTGAIQVNANITSNGGDITMGGGAAPGSTQAIGDASIDHGIDINAATIDAGGGNISMYGAGSDNSHNNKYGVYIYGGATVQTSGTGTITLNGTGGGNNTDVWSAYDYGVYIDASSITGAAAISITGAGGGTAATSGGDNTGILLSNAATVAATGSGTVTMVGTGNTTGGDGSNGITIAYTNTKVSVVNGNMSLTGTGGSSGISDNNYGVFIMSDNTGSAIVETTGTGAISITGTGGTSTFSGGANNHGIYLFEKAIIRSTAVGGGSITLNGTGNGDGAGNFSHGVYLDGYADIVGISSVDGAISITGQTGGYGTGIHLSADGNAGNYAYVTSSGTATITMNGTGGTAGNDNNGISINDDSIVSSVTGNISITGTAGLSGGNANIGVTLSSGGIIESTGAATINITGTGKGSGGSGYDYGVEIINTAVVRSTAVGGGSITINGTGGNGDGDANNGVRIDGGTGGAGITSVDGAISITGIGGTSIGDGNYGVNIYNSVGGAGNYGYVTSTGSATITINGTGGGTTAASDGNYGVNIQGTNSRVSTVNGNISITGMGGPTSADYNEGITIGGGTAYVETTGTGNVSISGTGGGSGTAAGQVGVEIYNGGIVRSTLNGGGGSITITGIGGTGSGGQNYGVWMDGAAAPVITSRDGAITVNGKGGTGANNYGFFSDGTSGLKIGTGTGSTTGTLTLAFDSWTVDNATRFNTTGAYIVKPYTAGGTIGVGTGAGTLTLDATTITHMSLANASSLTVGSATTGAIDINYTTSLPTHTTFDTNGATITSSSNMTIGANKYLTFNDPVSLSAARTITSTTGAGQVNFLSTINGAQTFTVANNTSTVHFAGAIGGVTPLTSVTVSGSGTTTIDSNVTTTGIQSYAGAVTLGGNVTMTTTNSGITITGALNGTNNGSESLTTSTGTGTSTFSSTIGATKTLNNLSITSDAVSFGGNISGTGTFTLRPSTDSVNMHINDGTSSGLFLNSTMQGYLQNGWADLIFGKTSLTGTLTVGASTWNDNTSFISGSGVMTISGAQTMGANNLTMQTDSNLALSADVTGTGNLTIKPSTITTTMNIGGNTNTIQLSAAEMAHIIAGWNSETFGRIDGTGAIVISANTFSDTTYIYGGAITTAGTIAPVKNLTIGSTGSVTISNAITKSSGADATLTINAAADITTSAAITSSNNKLNVVLDADSDASGSGAIKVGGAITSNGGAITMGGGADPTTTNAIGDATNVYGVEINGVTVDAGGGNIILRGTGYANGSNKYGVYIHNVAVVQTSGAGTITMNGTGGGSGAGNTNSGIYINDAGTTVTVANGNLTMTGIGGNTSGNTNVGVDIANSAVVESTGTGNISITGTGVGSGTSDTSYGVYVESSGIVRSTGNSGGTITINGTGGNGSGDFNEGVRITSGTATVTSKDGAISITGTGGTGTGVYHVGINLRDTGVISSTGTATITLVGNGGGSGSGNNNNGIIITDGGIGAAHITSVTGNISITGNGGTGSSGDYIVGVGIWQGAYVETTGAATISITGTGGGTGGSAEANGIEISNGAIVRSTGNSGGGITLDGTGGGGSGSHNSGIQLAENSATVTSKDGAISIIGHGGTGGDSAFGIETKDTAVISSTGTATISLNGTGGGAGAGASNYGILMQDSASGASHITSVTGNIGITGVGGATTGQYNIGIVIQDASYIESTGAATITLLGTGGGSGASDTNWGIDLYNGGIVRSTLNGGGGSITITGIGGGGSGGGNVGVGIDGGAGTITSRDGAITVTGTGGAGANSYGFFSDNTAGIKIGTGAGSTTGDISMIVDTWSVAANTNWNTTGNYLIRPYTAAGTTVGVAGGAGTLDINTTILGQFNLASAASMTIGATNDTGAMIVNAYTWPTNLTLITGSGLMTIAGAQALGAHNLTMQTDSDLTISANLTGTGTLTAKTSAAATTMEIQGTGQTVNISNAELGKMIAGWTSLNFGASTQTGLIKVNNYNWADNVNFINGSGEIRFTGGTSTLTANKYLTATTTSGDITAPTASGGIVASGTGYITLNSGNDINFSQDFDLTTSTGAVSLLAKNSIIESASGDITTSNAAITLNSDSDASGAGAISLGSGTVLTSGGGNITLGGGASPSTTAAYGTAANPSGVSLNAATITAGGGAVSIRGQGYTGGGTASNYGVNIYGGSSVTTTGSGTISLIGTGGNGTGAGGACSAGCNIGVGISYATVSVVDGDMTITGIGGSSSSNYDGGVGIDNGLPGSFGSTSVTASGSGNITINGTGGGSGASTNNYGVGIAAATNIFYDVTVSVNNGNLSITGQGGATTGGGNYGFGIVSLGTDAATVSSSGSGTITINATGGGSGAGSSDFGAYLTGSTSSITSVTGNIAVTGTGGSGSAGSNYGINVISGADILSTGAAAITLTGIGGSGASNYGIRTTGATVTFGGGSAAGDITFNTDTWSLANEAITTTGNVYIKPYSQNGTIAVAGAAAGNLAVSTAILNLITANTVTIGRSDGTGLLRFRGWDASARNYHLALLNGSSNIQLDGVVNLTMAANKNFSATTTTGDIVDGSTASGESITTSGTGTITLTSGGDIDFDQDFDLTSAAAMTLYAKNSIIYSGGGDITTTATAITLNADSDASGVGAISLGSGTDLTSNGGNIILGGGADPSTTAAYGTASNKTGVTLNGATLTSGAGNIIIRGHGYENAAATDAIGVDMQGTLATTTGNITINGVGGGGTTGNLGIYNGGTTSTTSGAISFTGTGGTEDDTSGHEGNLGIYMGNASIDSSGTGGGVGAITITGNGAAAWRDNVGVSLIYTSITSADANITVTGTGGANAAGDGNNTGIYVYGGGNGGAGNPAVISSSGTGNVTLTGTAGTASINGANGIFLDYTGSGLNTITTNSGTLTMTGTGANGDGRASQHTDGIYNAVPVTYGNFYSTSGDVTLTGIAGTGGWSNAGISNYGILGNASSTGNLTLIADSILHDPAATYVTTGNVYIKPYSQNGTIGINGATGTLQITSALLGAITANTTILGRSDGTGLMRVAGADLSADTFGHFSLLNGSANIQFDGGGTALKFASNKNFSATTTSGSITAPTASGTIQTQGTGTITLTSGTDINFTQAFALTTSTGAVSLVAKNDIITSDAITTSGGAVTLNSDSDATSAGAIVVGGNITTSGANITLGGGADPTTTAAYGDAAHNHGILISGATVNAGAGNLIAIGHGYNNGGSSDHYGISLIYSGGQGTLQTTSGTLTVTGTGGTGQFADHGIFLNDGRITTASGTANITGTGGSGSITNYGVYVQGSLGEISSTGSGGGLGTVTITGTGGTSTSTWNSGVEIYNDAVVTTKDANLVVSGTGGGGSGSTNNGIELDTRGNLTSTGSGTITMTGVSGAGAGGYGISLSSGPDIIGGASATGNITLNTDTISLAASTSIRTTGTVYFKTYSQNGTIGVNGSAGTLGLTSTYLGYVNAGTTSIGRSDGTGLLRITGADLSASTVGHFSLLNGSANIQFDGGTLTLAANKTFSTATASGSFNTATADGTIVTSGTGDITLDDPVSLAKNLTLTSAGTVTFGSTINGAKDLTATAGTFSFGGAIGGTTPLGAVSLTSTNAIALPDITASTVFARSTGAAADLTTNGVITASGAGDAIVLVAGRNYVNNAGATPLVLTGGGRWIGYSSKSTDDTNGITSTQVITGKNYGNLPPGSIVPATYNGTQNTWVYNLATGTITITAADKTMTYGNAVPAFTYSFSCSDGCLEGDVMSGSLTTNATTSTSGNYNAGIWDITIGSVATNNGYTINFTPGVFTVNTRAITITGMTADNKVYDATNTATLNHGGESLVGKVDGFQNGGGGPVDIVTIDTSGATGTFNNANVGNGKTVTAAGIVLGGADAANYTLTQPTTTANITPRGLTVTASDVTQTYADGTTLDNVNGFGAVGLQGGETIGSVTLGSTATLSSSGNWNAGNWAINVSGATGGTFDAGNYTITYVAGAHTINTKAMTIAGMTASNKVYDGTDTATLDNSGDTLVGTVAGLNNGGGTSDTVTLNTSTTGTFNNANVGNGKAVTGAGFSLSGADAANYTLTQPSTTANITARGLTVTASDVTHTYADGTTLNGVTGFSALGLQNGETIGSVTLGTNATFSTSGNWNAGSWTLTPSAAIGGTFNAANYTITYNTGTHTINKAGLTISGMTADNKVYDATTTATLNHGGESLVGVVSGLNNIGGGPDDTVTFDTSGATGTFADKNVGNGKAVTASGITLGGADAANYTLTQPSTTANITKADLTVTADDKTRTYGAANPSFTYGITGFVGGEVLGTSGVTGTASLSTLANATSSVGDYDITTALGSLAASNYSFTLVDGTLSVTKAALTVTASNQTKTYGFGGNSAALGTTGFTSSGLLNGETIGGVTLSTNATTSTSGNYNAGVWTLTPSLANGGTFDINNYTVTYNNAGVGLTINTQQLSANVTANDKVYDGTANATGSTGALIGVVGIDDVAFAGVDTYSFANKNVGVGKTVTVSGLSLAGGDAANYSLAALTDTADITTKDITVALAGGPISKVYDGTNLAALGAHYSFTGVLGGDTVNLSAGTSTYDNKNVGVGKTVSFSGLSLAGGDAGNYNLTTVALSDTIGTVTARALTVTADDKIKRTGAADPSLTYSYGALATGDNTSIFSGALTRVAGEDIGTYAITQGSFAVDSNYALTFVDGTLTISDASSFVSSDFENAVLASTRAVISRSRTGRTLNFFFCREANNPKSCKPL